MKNGPRIYVLSPAFLYRITQEELQPVEKMALLSGMVLMGTITVITDTHFIKMVRANRHGADPDPAALLQLELRLHAMGLRIVGQAHSHPGTVAEATYPSNTDLETARAWESMKPFIGFIASEGGRWVRAFNYRQESVVKIYGDVIQPARGSDGRLFELPPITAGGELVRDAADPIERRAAHTSAAAVQVVESASREQREDPMYWLRWARR